MEREEVQDLLAMIQGAYPNYRPADKTSAINSWTMTLEEYDKDRVALALKLYIQTDTSGFAPAPGQLIDKIQMVSAPQELNEMEAWALVSKAIRNSGYNSVEEFHKLPPIIQKAVGLPEQLRTWALDEDYNETVVSSNFIKCYRVELNRQKEISKMPENVRQLIEKVNDNRGIAVKPYMAIEEKSKPEHHPMSERTWEILEKFKENMQNDYDFDELEKEIVAN